MFCNLLTLWFSQRHRYNHYAYRVLFWNLSIANILSIITLFFGNNLLYFQDIYGFLTPDGTCQHLALLAAVNTICAVPALVSGISLFGFGIVHYILLCCPFQSDLLLAKCRVRLAILLTWFISTCIGMAVFIPCLNEVNSDLENCSLYNVQLYGRVGTDTSLVLLTLCYLGVIVFSVRIYTKIRSLRTSMCFHVWDGDLQYERQALKTLLLMLLFVAIFWMPYAIIYALSQHGKTDTTTVFHFMTLLPYVQYACEPLVYGKRMLGLQHGVYRVVDGMKQRLCCQYISQLLTNSSFTDSRQTHC